MVNVGKEVLKWLAKEVWPLPNLKRMSCAQPHLCPSPDSQLRNFKLKWDIGRALAAVTDVGSADSLISSVARENSKASQVPTGNGEPVNAKNSENFTGRP
jgi:hypothetical protein